MLLQALVTGYSGYYSSNGLHTHTHTQCQGISIGNQYLPRNPTVHEVRNGSLRQQKIRTCTDSTLDLEVAVAR